MQNNEMNSRKGILLLVLLMLISALLLWLVIREKPFSLATFVSGEAAIPPEPPLVLEITGVSDAYPALAEGDSVLIYTGFHLLYNEEYEQAAWVAYILTGEQVLSGTENRTENFRADTAIATGSATPRDYLRSGYDRGHLAPAADMKWSSAAMSESFLMSNMSPQAPGFNRGVWSRLESKVRDWAVENDSILVITGPVFYGIDVYIGENLVGVPEYYFKVVADISPPDYKVISFLLENTSSSADLFSFAVSIDSLEVITGYDFFAAHPDQEMIEKMEAGVNTAGWF
jgi:endonuclease G, mitochondrial